MKFFKHFTDSHRGQSLRILKNQFGFEGIGRYWTLVELCAEKLEKLPEEEFSEAHCHFEFEKSYVMGALGYPNLTLCRRYLDAIATLGLCSIDENETLYRCSMPKLLESLDRDTRRARKVRGPSAPKIKNKDKEEDKDKENIKRKSDQPRLDASEFETFWSLYPRKIGKGKTGKLYASARVAGAKAEDLLLARDKYISYLKEQGTETRFIKHGPTFMAGWRDWLDPEVGSVVGIVKKETVLELLERLDREEGKTS